MIEFKTVSLANQIYEKIEMDILTGVYEHGEILTETKLSENLNVSRTPIREALARLINDNLIADNKKGVVVLGITKDDVRDMMEVKQRLEIYATVNATELISDEDLKVLKELIEEQEFYVLKKDPAKVMMLDSKFHSLIYANCGSMIIESILTPLHRRLLKYRMISLESESRMKKSVEEHILIYEAMKNRDKALVEKYTSIHIQNAKKNICNE